MFTHFMILCLHLFLSHLPEGGISIPSSYTSFLGPLSSSKLHLEVSVLKDKEKAYPHANFETPYVVRLHNADVLADPQACFSFHHPNYGETTPIPRVNAGTGLDRSGKKKLVVLLIKVSPIFLEILLHNCIFLKKTNMFH